MYYTCANCYQPVSEDTAFVRSVNLRTVAWCSPCWRQRHPELFVPSQREPVERQTRWRPRGLPRRENAGG